jgi:hypothetical protein
LTLLRTALLGLCLLTTVSCRSATNPGERSAIIRSPTPEAHTEIRRAISEALGGVDVRLPEDVFTRSSLLIVERAPHRAPGGERIQGRELGQPDHFRLVIADGDCVLLHVQSGLRQRLTDSLCVAE